MLKSTQITKQDASAALMASRSIVYLTSLFFLLLLLWQAYSSVQTHKDYQVQLMDAITDRVLSEYQEYISSLRLQIDYFQSQHQEKLAQLDANPEQASLADYRPILQQLLEQIEYTRLFAIVDSEGNGTLRHIVGDFGKDCQVEVQETLAAGAQQQLFLHRVGENVHFDLLQPLLANKADGKFIFVAFNPVVFQDLLKQYQLPHQRLFLLRKDRQGTVELRPDSDQTVQMNQSQLQAFSFVKAIPDTRWQIAIRLEENYQTTIYLRNFSKALIIWSILSLLIFATYRWQRKRTLHYMHMKQEMRYKDEFDQLTQISNRSHFESQLTQYLQQKQGMLAEVGVLFQLDLDQFQLVNNNQGYAFGDQVLAQLSQHLCDYLPSYCLLSRLGNDEFAILDPNLPHSAADEFAQDLRLYIEKLPLGGANSATQITTSIGVLLLDIHQQQVQQILICLNQAVHLAKQKGRNRVQMYQSADRQLQAHAKEMALVEDIREALNEHRFVLYRQQIRALHPDLGEQNLKYEVLIRMLDIDGNILAPGVFIPAAEKYGQIEKIDFWVIESVCQALSAYPQSGCFSINLSGISLAQPEFIEKVKALFRQYQVNTNQLAFEITETAAISNMQLALRFIEAMQALGCQFYLDDFGSGACSMGYLQQMPVTTIKIDGSFVKDMEVNPVNHTLVENIQRMAATLEKSTVAEFVETQGIAEALVGLGVNYGQGYFFHKPEAWYTRPQSNQQNGAAAD